MMFVERIPSRMFHVLILYVKPIPSRIFHVLILYVERNSSLQAVQKQPELTHVILQIGMSNKRS